MPASHPSKLTKPAIPRELQSWARPPAESTPRVACDRAPRKGARHAARRSSALLAAPKARDTVRHGHPAASTTWDADLRDVRAGVPGLTGDAGNARLTVPMEHPDIAAEGGGLHREKPGPGTDPLVSETRLAGILFPSVSVPFLAGRTSRSSARRTNAEASRQRLVASVTSWRGSGPSM
jgi:hypothetical protein